ncbi:MAG: D,D-heptose 1,7-bisphosphate phosphatase [Candidatus Omnitrophica bacterium CG11_big_fil_rev_8_21_14_0_20_63_9]|nr:MAG: D,D-heptose 1,7-bisphosphate phosphatase [Candidatus Omnitrophica bacterium CG11_big_fil_rev_8_21_14_0_20_63_9]
MTTPGRGGHGERRAVFLDRDGTVARYREYCCRVEEFELLPDVGKAIQRLNQAGLPVIIVTNQSAIGRGWLTTETLEAIHDKMRRELARSGARVDAIYVCPHRPDEGCACRKPRSAMLQRAASEFRLSLPDSYMVGDRQLDMLSGRAVGSRTVLVRTGHQPEADGAAQADYSAETLEDAVRWILGDRRKPHGTD